jgi:hypothetical protein
VPSSDMVAYSHFFACYRHPMYKALKKYDLYLDCVNEYVCKLRPKSRDLFSVTTFAHRIGTVSIFVGSNERRSHIAMYYRHLGSSSYS